jgi:glycosyltransferase involved in cell wall biosynthesis
MLKYYHDRVAVLRRKPRPDLIWLEYEALPWLPWAIEQALLPSGVPIVSDYDDAVFHRYDQHTIAPVRWLLGDKIDGVMAASALVLAGNDYLEARARRARARVVEIVPTVVDITSYSLRSRMPGETGLRIGWIGTPSTWSAYMEPLMPLLASVAASYGARLTAVGPGRDATQHPLLDQLPWSEDTEVASIQAMDIGIMPLTDTPWSRGKCGYKLIQYMACGLPVVASPIGVNAEIVEHGVNGFLATTEAEWREALEILLRDPALRDRMGQQGRHKIERQYSLQVWGPRVAALLRDVAVKGQENNPYI